MKFASIGALLLTGLLGMTSIAMFYPWDEPEMVGLKSDAQVSEEYVSYFCFKQSWNTTLQQLAQGQISLSEACDRVQSASERNFPNFLNYIAETDPAPTVREQIARNFLGHLKRVEIAAPSLAPNVRAAEGEFAVMY
ncbi:MAG TPA: hypothetical protein VFE62_05640 [Gemmataceae bacterium]|nr:hypothetical protein [Gemmataceae bacterium]